MGGTVNLGPLVKLSGTLNVGTINFATNGNVNPEGYLIPTIRQGAGVSVTLFNNANLTFPAGEIREAQLPIYGDSINSPFEALNGVPFSPYANVGISKGNVSGSQSLLNSGGDTIIGVGIQALIGGFEVGVNLTEIGRQTGEFVYDLTHPSSSASGGFVLYPNRINTNMVQQVYSK